MLAKLICRIFGHHYQKVVYADPRYDVYICPVCGEQIKLVRIDGWRKYYGI